MKRTTQAIATTLLILVVILGVQAGSWRVPAPPAPIQVAWYTTFEGGSGYRDILAFSDETGAFPVRAAIDREWRILYVGYSNGSIRWWNFSNETAITHGVWRSTVYTCSWGGMELGYTHTLFTACGPRVNEFFDNGTLIRSIEFPAEVEEFGLSDPQTRSAGPDGIIVVGLAGGADASVQIRNLTSGGLVLTIPVGSNSVGRQTTGLAVSSNGNLLGLVLQGSPHLFDLQNGTNRTFGAVWGSIAVPSSSGAIWVIKSGGWDEDLHDQMMTFGAPWGDLPSRKFGISSASPTPLGSADVLETNSFGTEAAYLTSDLTSTHYTDGTGKPGNDQRGFVHVYDLNGTLVRGMQVNGGLVSLTLNDDGSLYAVTMIRTVLHGSQLWLSYGAPDCSPPILLRHNATA